MVSRHAVLSILLVACVAVQTSGKELADTTKRIAWKSSVLDAFVEAVEANKTLVVVFLSNPAHRGEDGKGNFSNRQRIELDELVIHQLADDAVFAMAQFDHRTNRISDEYAERMYRHLKIDELPTISVIAPRTDLLTELYRMEGIFMANDIAKDLAQCFKGYSASQVPAQSKSHSPAKVGIPTANTEFNPYELQPRP